MESLITGVNGQFHQHVYAHLLRAKIPKVQKRQLNVHEIDTKSWRKNDLCSLAFEHVGNGHICRYPGPKDQPINGLNLRQEIFSIIQGMLK